MSIFFPSSGVGLGVELPFSLLQVRHSNPRTLGLILRTFHVMANCSDQALPDPSSFLTLLLHIISSLDECKGAVIPQS